MKVILIEDVKGVGKKGDIIEASDGHARNYLLPRKLGVEANKANMNDLERQKKAKAQKEKEQLEVAQLLASEIEGVVVKVGVKVGDGGKLFGSVTNKEIGEALSAQHGIEVDKKRINILEPIKTSGEKTAQVKLHPSVNANLKIEIVEG